MLKRATCHSCGVKEGELHKEGCDMEKCPFCGHQLISCDCAYELLGVDVSEGTLAYEHGLTEEQEKEWGALLRKKGLIPYVQIPIICALCGKLWPDIDMSTESGYDWEQYVIPPLQPKILCQDCYDRMKLLFPKGWRKAK
jgi:hypothetical protein